MLHQYIRATASSLLLMSCYWLYIHTGKLDGNKEPLLLDNDLCIMVHQRCPERRPTAVKDSGLWFLTRWKREESLWPLFILLGMHAYSMNQTLRSMVFARSILDCSFTFHIYTRPSSVYPLLLLHFQGNRRSKKKKSHCFGHITRLHSTSSCVTVSSMYRVRRCVVNICRLHIWSAHLKRGRDADLTLSRVSFIYMREDYQNAGHACS